MAQSVDETLQELGSAIQRISDALAQKTAGDAAKASLGGASLDLLSKINKEIGVSIRGRAAAVTTVTLVTLVTLFDDDEEVVITRW